MTSRESKAYSIEQTQTNVYGDILRWGLSILDHIIRRCHNKSNKKSRRLPPVKPLIPPPDPYTTLFVQPWSQMSFSTIVSEHYTIFNLPFLSDTLPHARFYNKVILNQHDGNFVYSFYIILHCSFNLLISGIPSGPRFMPGAISSIISAGGWPSSCIY